jgi:hypothetical protein
MKSFLRRLNGGNDSPGSPIVKRAGTATAAHLCTIATALTVLLICSFEFFFSSLFCFLWRNFHHFGKKRKGRSNRVVFIFIFLSCCFCISGAHPKKDVALNGKQSLILVQKKKNFCL